MTNKYVIEHNFSYGWDLLKDQEVNVYDTRAEAQDSIDELVINLCSYHPEDYRIKKVRVSLPISPYYNAHPDRENDPDYSETDRKVDDLLTRELKTFDYKSEDIFTDVGIVVANSLHKCGGSWTLEIHPDLEDRFKQLLDDNERAFK